MSSWQKFPSFPEENRNEYKLSIKLPSKSPYSLWNCACFYPNKPPNYKNAPSLMPSAFVSYQSHPPRTWHGSTWTHWTHWILISLDGNVKSWTAVWWLLYISWAPWDHLSPASSVTSHSSAVFPWPILFILHHLVFHWVFSSSLFTWSPGLHSLPQLWTSEKCPHYSRIARVQHTLPLGLMGFLRLAQTTLPREKGAHSTVNPGPMLRCLLFEQSQTFHNWFLYILPTVGFLTCHFQGE